MSKEKINFRLSLYFENYFVISSSAFCNCTSFSCDKLYHSLLPSIYISGVTPISFIQFPFGDSHFFVVTL